MTALTLGIFLSSFANSEFQMMQFIPLVIVPQVFFSGLFNIDTMATWLRWLSKIMPLESCTGIAHLTDTGVRQNG
ncbi:ABC transporter permease [Alicyclobacillus herbarius]|uniref:ABC transporter permease n=1 Tax=Alicyclobacillus herbarius TaxID=122960 RepID=UPI002354ED6E|nr:ABC transporter permease [Alicyclobacillus herbarius]